MAPIRFSIPDGQGEKLLAADELWKLMVAKGGDMRTMVTSSGHGSLAMGALGWLLMLDGWTPVNEPAESFSLAKGDVAALRDQLRRYGEQKASGALWLSGPQGQKAVMYVLAGELRYVWNPVDTQHALPILLDEPAQMGPVLQGMIGRRIVMWKALRECVPIPVGADILARRFRSFLLGRVRALWGWHKFTWRFATGTGAPYELPPGSEISLLSGDIQGGGG
ncbi:MAG: hypothetical protein AB2A00_32940 [Myxococcota bacterium]